MDHSAELCSLNGEREARVWVWVSTDYKHEGYCLCLGETDQLDLFIDESGFKEPICVVYVWNVRKFKASWYWTRIVGSRWCDMSLHHL